MTQQSSVSERNEPRQHGRRSERAIRHWRKTFHGGIASRKAVEAGVLAQSGLGGRLDIFERPQGFLDSSGAPGNAEEAGTKVNELCSLSTPLVGYPGRVQHPMLSQVKRYLATSFSEKRYASPYQSPEPAAYDVTSSLATALVCGA